MASVADTGDQAPPSPPPPPEVIVIRRSPWRRVAKWTAIVVGALLAALIAFLLWLNSDSGRRFIVDQINGLEMASGLKINIDRIDGSIWGEMTVHGLTLADPEGVFFAADTAEVNYSPLSYVRRSQIEIHALHVPTARLSRLPVLRTVDPNAPLIPDILLDIDDVRVDRLQIDPAVTGRAHALRIAGNVHLAESAVRTDLDISALTEEGLAGGDRLTARLDAAPEQDRLGIELFVDAPANGFVASMTGIEKRLRTEIRGRGDWSNWAGRLNAALDEDGFADLAIQAQDGRFTVNGPTRPDLFVTGPAQRLTGPYVQLNFGGTWIDRRIEGIDLSLNSRALAIVAEGAIDLGQSQYRDLAIGARLLQPGAIAPNLSGRDVRLALVMNGAMATPAVAYEVSAQSIGISTRTLENFRASGAARVDADRIVVPVAATMSRITGLPDAVGGLLTNVRINGDLLIEGTNLLSDNLRVRSDRADAVLAIAFDLSRGTYNVGIQGRVNDYLVQSIGVFDISSDFDLVGRADGFGLQGRVSVRSRRIFNQTALDLLGGMATATATINVGGNGDIRIGDVRLTAPQLRITEGGGNYYADGRIALQLRGTSNRYGDVAVQIGGTISAPRVELTIAEAGFGVGLRAITANIVATAQGYQVNATGQSNYGPFEADLLILARAGPLTVQVNRLLFAGVTFAGQIQQTQAGPFAGSLTASGRGIDGNIQLAALGPRQRIEIDATAQNAVIPSTVEGVGDINIERGIIDVAISLPTTGDPFAIYEATGDVQVANLRAGSFALSRARANINYAGNSGNARFVATGSSGVPFDLAGNADLNPERIRLALQGTANSIPFRFAEPAVIEQVEDAWVLRPVNVQLEGGRGSMRLAGRFGDGLIIQSRLDAFDIAIANAISPGLGLGGEATGSLDFYLPADGTFPRAESRLNIRNFTRTGIAVRSVPVDISLTGALRPEGGSLASVFRQGGNVIGRLQANLTPLPPGAGSWTERLRSAPLGGGIRYNGPASVLTSLAGLTGHQLQGPIAVGADFTGRVDNPQFNGIVRAENVTYTNETYGTRITNIALDGRFNGPELQITSLTGRAGEGTVRASGSIGLSSAAGYPITLDARLDNARLARSEDISATATGDIQVRNLPNERAIIRGRLELGEIRYQIVRQGGAQVVNLSGVRRRGEPLVQPGQQREAAAAVPSAWRLELDLVADNRVFVSGMGLESEWGANLQVRGSTSTPILTGTIDLVRGTLSFAGRRFILDDRSNISFPRRGDGVINPQIEITATSEIDDVNVSVVVEGSAGNPRISFAAVPDLPQDEIVSRILFGSSVSEISAIQAIQLAASLNSLRGGSGGLDPLGSLQRAAGIDRLRILGEDDTTGRGTAVAAGFYLSDDIYIEIITDAEGFTATQLEISLSPTLSILSQFGTTTGTNVNLRYSRDY